MGIILSRLRLTLVTFRTIARAYEELSKKIAQSPGIPVPDPCTPYWAVPPSPISKHGSEDRPPHYADVVIIGSGITGASFARTLLKSLGDQSPVEVVMLDARDACSGATARNGGHCTPVLYQEYRRLKNILGVAQAKAVIRFRLAHLAELLQVARDEQLLEDSQCREVETFDVFFEQELFDGSKERLEEYIADIPEEAPNWSVIDGAECVERLQLSRHTVGAIATKAGSLHPYRLVTGVLSRLLESYADTFHLFSNTPCTSISPPAESPQNLYTVHTPKGPIHTPHVVHATNAWASYLLEPMRTKIVPIRGNMTAQRPGQGLGHILDDEGKSWTGTRSFVFYPGLTEERFDYLTQQPPVFPSSSSSSYPPPSGEFMFGGGFLQGGIAERAFFEEVGNIDDRGWNLGVSAYLSGALAVYFSGKEWGEEGRPSPSDGESFDKGRVKRSWGGIIGISSDGLPWVGRLPSKVSGRKPPSVSNGVQADDDSESFVILDSDGGDVSEQESTGEDVEQASPLAPSGEWIAAGYSGEGMVHAWLSGKALAYMVLGQDVQRRGMGEMRTDCSRDTILEGFTADALAAWLPASFEVTEERWKKANIENYI